MKAMAKCPVESTYCSDPLATHIVEGIDRRINGHGSGILGYFKSELDAHRVARFYRNDGVSQVSVQPYDPTERTAGIHPLVQASMQGY